MYCFEQESYHVTNGETEEPSLKQMVYYDERTLKLTEPLRKVEER